MTERTIPDKRSRRRQEMIESADYLHAIGGLDDAAHAKITMRELTPGTTPTTAAHLSADEIRAIRAAARMSQAVFAKHLNVSTGYISQLERGTKRPVGAALVLLNVIRRRGMHALLAE